MFGKLEICANIAYSRYDNRMGKFDKFIGSKRPKYQLRNNGGAKIHTNFLGPTYFMFFFHGLGPKTSNY